MTGRIFKPMRRPADPAEWLAIRIDVDEHGCWLWRHGLNQGGYPLMSQNGRTRSAHRWAYETFVGPVPPGLQLDHLCRVRRCVNPSHLEPVTAWENNHRSPLTNAAKTQCPQGHPYSPENTYVAPSNRRFCRTCQRVPRRARRERAA